MMCDDYGARRTVNGFVDMSAIVISNTTFISSFSVNCFFSFSKKKIIFKHHIRSLAVNSRF